MQDQPNQTTLSMPNESDGLIMSESRDATSTGNLEEIPLTLTAALAT
jgi:hypothetical protein